MRIGRSEKLSKIRCIISFVWYTLLTLPLLVGTYNYWENDKYKSCVCVILFLIGLGLNLFTLYSSLEYIKCYNEEVQLEKAGYNDIEIEKILCKKYGDKYHEYNS